MAIWDLFSKRLQRGRVPPSDVYAYDQLPQQLRVQLVQIIHEAVGDFNYSIQTDGVYNEIQRVICKELGVFRLHEDADTSQQALFNFVLQTPGVEQVLDVIELFGRYLNNQSVARGDMRSVAPHQRLEPREAIDDINARFREHAIGYQLVDGEIIRVDSQLVHAEIFMPAVRLLHDPKYSTASEEFLLAHEHYRHGRNKECLVNALASIESVMKVICAKRGWTVEKNATAKALINAVLTNGLLPAFMESELHSLRGCLEGALPAVRNKLAAHGQGEQLVAAPDHFVRFGLNSAASAILLLVEADKALK